MSDHEVEDLVEHSVRALDACFPVDDRRVRDWIGALYRFQDGHDCSFTQGRVEDVLLRRGFTLPVPPGDSVPLIDVLRALSVAARETGDRELIAQWCDLVPGLCALYDLDVDEADGLTR
ncbi:hypothetical protein [Streptomyces sp. NBC_00582]|uniref:hypothetical protein n=1 Tax=Streptomyces sp. NBC_00582 TaxID=2975783 RepID=UPI0010638401|nr:hypothetical protein [Streptomyces sp. NBC_00582]WUB61862.1 hypothetical protein OG852_16410 [Streptomyces sp. NBC_00582]